MLLSGVRDMPNSNVRRMEIMHRWLRSVSRVVSNRKVGLDLCIPLGFGEVSIVYSSFMLLIS